MDVDMDVVVEEVEREEIMVYRFSSIYFLMCLKRNYRE